MSFEEVKPKKNKIIKVSDLVNESLVGKYVKQTQGRFGPIYWILTELESEVGIYGNKSLIPLMSDDLLGQKVEISCVELKDIGREYPFPIASVRVWRMTMENLLNGNHHKIPTPHGYPKGSVLDRFIKKAE